MDRTLTDIDRRAFFQAAALLPLALAAGKRARATRRGGTVVGEDESEVRIQRLAWAGVKLQLGEITLLIDPLAKTDLWGLDLGDTLVPIEIDTPQVRVLITHLHGDHFDPVALSATLGDQGEIFCFEDVAAAVASRGYRVQPLALFEPRLIGGFTVVPVPASDGFGIPQVSWVVTGGGRRIIHCGDTLWHGSWWEIGKQYGPFDVAFLPINGFRFFGRNPDVDVASSLTPEQAAAVAQVLDTARIVPIHYGLDAPFYREEPDAESRLLVAAQAQGIGVEIVTPGRWLA